MHDNRHPVLEYVVFGLAGVLALILMYYGFTRWQAGRPAAAPQDSALSQPSDGAPEETGTLQHSGTVQAVNTLPPVKLSAGGKKRR